MSHTTTIETSGAVFAANRAVGRVALSVKTIAGATRRARVHEAGALRVRCPGPPAAELEAVIVNTAGGMAGGDRFDIEIAVGAGAQLVVTTAAAEKIYRTLGPDTQASVKILVAAGGTAAWLPQETILFDRARLRRTIDVELADDARLILAEAVVFGRSGMGERIGAGLLRDRWRVRQGGRLVYAETARLEGTIAEKLSRAAIAKSGIAIATVLVVPGDEGAAAAARALGDRFKGEVGVSAWNGLAAVRLVADDGACLRHDLATVLGVLRGTALPRLWLN